MYGSGATNGRYRYGSGATNGRYWGGGTATKWAIPAGASRRERTNWGVNEAWVSSGRSRGERGSGRPRAKASPNPPLPILMRTLPLRFWAARDTFATTRSSNCTATTAST
eukprot:scaffold17506_cov132-Isochrysis_galbana.AAC.13